MIPSLIPIRASGIQEIRRSEKRGKHLPSPRAVSLAVSINDVQEIDSSKTLAVMQWAQFIAHDVSHTPVRKMGEFYCEILNVIILCR